MVVVGVVGFAAASACCGFTPKGSIAEAWIIFFRVVQGAFAALMFPAAVGIVVASFPLRERGKDSRAGEGEDPCDEDASRDAPADGPRALARADPHDRA